MKLDATDLRYLTTEEFRVLTAVEMGSKNHEVVPNPLIAQVSGLRSGGVNKLLGSLAKRNLIAKVQNSKYEGYRLTYGGYDYLAMRALSKRETMYSVGNQIGVGKESDIYAVADAEGNQMVLKLHRLGRVSFRAIKTKRDYMGKRKSASWMYMSRLAAQKEWAFMKALHQHNFPVPKPIDQARHCILMELIDAYPLRQVAEVESPGHLYSTLMDVIVRFAHAGLIHGDFNEFNILIRRESGEPVVIDFPQMVSTSHENAEWYFNRDVECIRTFFRRRFQYESALYPRFKGTLQNSGGFRLDVVVAASGFARKDMKILEDVRLRIGTLSSLFESTYSTWML
ncbi:RIO1-domain-containing protein [Ramaria rubella]|nr:RIO1-domain-containing protein [Ramaria rubella]